MKPDPIGEPTPEDALGFMARSTPRLRIAVQRQQAGLPPAEFQEFLTTIRSVFAKYSTKLAQAAAGLERASTLHQLMEQAMRPASQVKVSCRKGCASCCHYEIEITADEAALLRAMVLNGVEIDRGRLAGQAARERRSALWNEVLNPENRCVFLGPDGACRVYGYRPSACRKHLVTSPAEACADPARQVAPVELLLAEILQSAALSLSGATFGSLSKMLQASLEADG